MVELLRLASVLGLVISCLLVGSILNTLGTGTLQSLMNSPICEALDREQTATVLVIRVSAIES